MNITRLSLLGFFGCKIKKKERKNSKKNMTSTVL
jgi:hypothetical protein